MPNRLNMKIFVYNVSEGELIEGNPEQVRSYVEDVFEEYYGFKLFLQAEVDNGEFNLLLNKSANKLNNEQQKVVDNIFCYRPLLGNQSMINKKHTENLEKALFLYFDFK
ncbi:hypothetical protein [Neobacillus muris]|uniref:hypothetical protein n=1 Tax=Neobacillus muris TaxID=2941334 RepID=UPI00203C35B1|nr:hypothetical protein [Neobacillus muris]